MKNINPYLVEGDDIVIEKRSIPISDVNPIKYGSIAIDNGFLIPPGKPPALLADFQSLTDPGAFVIF